MNKPLVDLTGARILTVDDVPANLDVLGQSLEGGGYNVLVATSGEMALKVVERTTPDLILLDVMMPGIDGFETCRRLKQVPGCEDVPVIFLTARGELEGILEGFRVGGVDYITKPFQKEEVLIRIQTHLERHRLAIELAELNATLEAKVSERTRQLSQRLLEVEGKDRIAQHLLSYHSLEETLGLLVEVVAQVMRFDDVAIYLLEGDVFRPAAALRAGQPGQPIPAEELPEWTPVGREHQAAFSRMLESPEPVSAIPEDDRLAPFAMVPIQAQDELLGLIKVERRDGDPMDGDTMGMLSSFALQAAVAINDSHVHKGSARWKAQLDDVMNLDEILQEPEQLDPSSQSSNE